jgi:hypothetical protein
MSQNAVGILVGLLVTIVAGAIITRYLSRQRIRKMQHQVEEHLAFLQYFVSKNRSLPQVQTEVMLHPGEVAYFSEPAQLAESRAVRYTRGMGGGTRIGRGMMLGGWGSRSASRMELQVLSDGWLVVTNQRVIFDGNTDNRTAPLEDVLSARAGSDYLDITISGRQKSHVFVIRNPMMARASIVVAKTLAENPEANIQFTADFAAN